MKGTFGVKSFFKFLPIVVRSLEVAVNGIHQVVKPIPNGCDSRFKELRAKIPQLIQECTQALAPDC